MIFLNILKVFDIYYYLSLSKKIKEKILKKNRMSYTLLIERIISLTFDMNILFFELNLKSNITEKLY